MSLEAKIDSMLSAWGRWAIRQASAAVGYPSCSPMFRDYRSSEVYKSQEPVGALTSLDMAAISEAVRMLPSMHKIVVIEVYQMHTHKGRAAKSLGISRPSLNQYLKAAQRLVAMNLDELSHKKISVDT